MWKLLRLFKGGSPGRAVVQGTLGDVPTHLARLLRAAPEGFLIIEVSEEGELFLQFTASATSIEMDHPLITDHQRARLAGMRLICEGLGVPVRETEGGRFLDCDLPHDSGAAAQVVVGVLRRLFNVWPSTPLRFISEGLPRAAP